MFCWDWHDFEDETNSSDHDEYEQYWSEPTEHVVRKFWAGRKLEDGYHYSVGFEKLTDNRMIEAFVGDTHHEGKPLIMPESGAWAVVFDLASGENQYQHVALRNPRQVRDVLNGVACAVYDHYNVTKAGLYVWYAAREDLIDFYDSVLGHGKVQNFNLKSIPKADNLKSEVNGRGYAIVTKYYKHPDC